MLICPTDAAMCKGVLKKVFLCIIVIIFIYLEGIFRYPQLGIHLIFFLMVNSTGKDCVNKNELNQNTERTIG